MTSDLLDQAKAYLVARQPEPLKCIHCGRTQYTGPMCTAMAMESCPNSTSGRGHTYEFIIKSTDGYLEEEAKKLAEFASQVWEQREKVNGDNLAALTSVNRKLEAAELALQKWVKAMDGRTPECAAEDLLNAVATCPDLRAALQAREQERLGYKHFLQAICLHLKIDRDSGLPDIYQAIDKIGEKARQQAVADQSETADILKRGLQNAVIYEEKRCYYRTANGVKMEIPKRYEMPIRVAMETIIRSLTPPPALTPKNEDKP